VNHQDVLNSLGGSLINMPILLGTRRIHGLFNECMGISMIYVEGSSFMIRQVSLIPRASQQVPLILLNNFVKTERLFSHFRQGKALPVLIKYEPIALHRVTKLSKPEN
jgi:hypothetical protein